MLDPNRFDISFSVLGAVQKTEISISPPLMVGTRLCSR